MEMELERSIDAQVCGYIGRGILSVRIDGSGHLIFTMTDGSELDLGPVIGGSGDGGGTVELDTTLTRAGMAAEAKAAGDAIAKVSAKADSALREAQSSAAAASAAQETADSAGQDAQSALQEALNAATVANQTASATGDLSKLETDHKADLVEAINELHGDLASGAGNIDTGSGTVESESWVWSDEVGEGYIPMTAFPATAVGIRLRVYCYGMDGETVVFEIQPPYDEGFLGGMLYGFTYQGMNVSFEDTGVDLVMTADTDLMLYGFYYTTAAAAGSGTEVWRDTELASGIIASGTNLSMGLNTGLTVGDLRAYRRWLFRFKNASKATLADFYLKVGAVANATSGTSILRNSTGGASVFYEWWDSGRSKLAVQSVFAGNPSMVDDNGIAVASTSTTHWMYHNIMTPSAIEKLADLSGYDDDTPVWICCTTAPNVDFMWEFRGVTQ